MARSRHDRHERRTERSRQVTPGAPERSRRVTPRGARLAGLGVGAGMILLLGAGRLPALAAPVWRPGELAGWLAREGPVDGTFAAIRIVALATGTYLVGVTVLTATSRSGRARRLRAVSVRLTVPPLRAWVAAIAGIGAWSAGLPVANVAGAGTVVTPALSTAAPAAPSGAATRRPQREHPGGPAPVLRPAAQGRPVAAPLPAPPVLRPAGPLPLRSGTAPSGSASSPARRPRGRPTRRHMAGAGDATRSVARRAVPGRAWVVEAGQSFWSIAEDVVHRYDPAGSAEAVGTYWWRLVEHNRSRLPVPGNPDLLYVGSEILLPPLP